ncbi:hypothetical protein JCM31598_24570 [Desulfonatronum parangueonense]
MTCSQLETAEIETCGIRKAGAPVGNTNAKKHGFYSQGAKKDWEAMDSLIRDCHRLLKKIESGELHITDQVKS